MYTLFFYPFAQGDFAEKRVLKLVEQFSGNSLSLSCYKELKLAIKPFTGSTASEVRASAFRFLSSLFLVGF